MKHRITIASLLAALCLALSAVTAVPSAAAVNSAENQRGLILTPDEAHSATLMHAVNRLRAKSPMPLDLADGWTDNRVKPANYDMTIILGVTGAAGAKENIAMLDKAWPANRPTDDEAWALKTISTNPLIIIATGNRPRAVLYAVWELADLLAMGKDVTALNRVETPRLAKRYVVPGGTAFEGRILNHPLNHHNLYMTDIDELPRYGINGIYLSLGIFRVGVGPGVVSLPLQVDKAGNITANQTTLPKWRNMLEIIKSYDFDVCATVDPYIPPGYDAKSVQKNYATGNIPDGFLAATEKFYTRYLDKLMEILPQLDGLTLSAGVEGANHSDANFKVVRTFLEGQDIPASAKVMQVYLDVLDRTLKKHNIQGYFRTHSFGITSEGILALREQLFKHPAITIIEDAFWPNEVWINGGYKLPIMAYLDEPLRARIDQRNKLGLFLLSDAEYFGAASLPNAIDQCHIYAMQELLKRNSDLAIFRIDILDRTPHGTLWGVAGIQLEQAALQLWSPQKNPRDIWNRWLERRWGANAAPFLSRAFANNRDIIFNGFTLDGLNAMFKSQITAKQWMPNWLPGERKMMMFAKPGTHLLAKKPAIVTSTDQFSVQLNNIAMPFKEFEARQAKAAAEIEFSLQQIEQAKPFLAKSDYDYLAEIFTNAKILLPVIHDMAQAAHAANLTKDNFDNIPDPKVWFEESIRKLEARAASKDVQWLTRERGYLYGNIAGELGKIVTAYRAFVAGPGEGGETKKKNEPGKK